jgi:hypothetical protein
MTLAQAATEFDICTIFTQDTDGSFTYRCRLGFWSVNSTDRVWLRGEAMRYWIQYWKDGEYTKLVEDFRNGRGVI